MYLAVNERKRLKKGRCCQYIQIAIRRILASKEVERRVAERKQDSRIFVALRMQSYYRRRVAQRLLVVLRLNAKALMIQKYLRGYIDFQQGRQKLYVYTMVIRLQKFYLKRHNNKHRNAIKVFQLDDIEKPVAHLPTLNKQHQATDIPISTFLCLKILLSVNRLSRSLIIAGNVLQKLPMSSTNF